MTPCTHSSVMGFRIKKLLLNLFNSSGIMVWNSLFLLYFNKTGQVLLISLFMCQIWQPLSISSCGVPQGSVLDPLLFSMYTTALSTPISSLSLNHYFYVDDTQLFRPFPECSTTDLLLDIHKSSHSEFSTSSSTQKSAKTKCSHVSVVVGWTSATLSWRTGLFF